MNALNERRKAARLKVNSSIKCFLKVVDGEYSGLLRDMSVTGLYMKLKDPGQPTGTCEVEIVLDGDNSRLKIECQGNIVRHDEEGVAVHFHSRLEWFPIVATYFQRSL